MPLLTALVCYAVLCSVALLVSRRQLSTQRRLNRFVPHAVEKGIPMGPASYAKVQRFMRETETDKQREIHAVELERDRQLNLARQYRDDFLRLAEINVGLKRKLRREVETNRALTAQLSDKVRSDIHVREKDRRHSVELARESFLSEPCQPKPVRTKDGVSFF